MKITDISINSNIISVNLNNLTQSNVFFCNDINTDSSLVLQFPSTFIPIDTIIGMEFIFNNINKNRTKLITEVKNGTGTIKSRWNNLDASLSTSHYIKQNIEIKYNVVFKEFECLHILERFNEFRHPIESDISLVTLLVNDNNKSIYKMHPNYYDLSVNADISTNIITTSWEIDDLMGADLESSAFDRYVVNIFDETGLLEDTSGNENKTDVSLGYTNANVKDASFTDWVVTVSGEVINRPVKVYKTYKNLNDNNYRFVFSKKKYRIKSIVLTQTNLGAEIAKISDVRYRYISNLPLTDNTYIRLLSTDMKRTNLSSTSTYKLLTPTLMSETLIQLDNPFKGTITLIGDIYDN